MSSQKCNINKMSTKEKHICRFCLKVAKNEFEVDEITRQMFEILLLKIDFDITRDPIICQDCMEVAKKCLEFKSTCIHTEQIILSYCADRKEVQHNIKFIYEPREHTRTVLEGFKICRFCITQFETNNFASMDTLRNKSIFEMLSQFMTEMDFNAIEYPIICAKCRENLEDYLKFVLNCLKSEEKLKAYCKKMGIDSMGQVKLGNVPQFRFIDILEYPDKCKIEQDRSGYVNPETHIEFIKQEELDIKDEKTILNKNSYRNTSEMNLDKYDNRFSPKEYDEETNFNMICLKARGNEKYIQANITEDGSVEDVLEMRRREISNMGINKGAMSSDETKQSKNIMRGICKLTSKPKQEKNDNRHMLIQKNSFNPQSHITVDRDVSKMKMHKCSLCIYETTKRYRLTEHMLVHKDVSEIKMQKCSLCPFESKHKSCLRHHILVHKDVSKIKMHKCPFCTYETKRKSSIEKHVLVHKDVPEIKLQKCKLCAFESKHKSSLGNHMLVHKDVSEIKMKKCSLCAFETKYKGSLTQHIMLAHKNVSEIKMHKCSLCAYECKQKSQLTSHILVHKDISEIKMHKCSYCTYEAKRKQNLGRHMLLHKDISEIKMHKCSLCAFESKHKFSLTKHMLVHKKRF